MTTESQRSRLTAIAAASDPVRDALFRFAIHTAREFSRDEAADALGLPRATAAFQLDRLTSAGLLEATYRRRTEKSGPGAGRPAKFYRVRVDEVCASIPERHYDLAAELLSAAVERTVATGEPIREAMATVATDRGESIGRGAASLESALEAGGYEPQPDGEDIILTNCPFHHLAANHSETICSLNHSLLRGVVAGAGHDADRAELAYAAPHCCVRIAQP